MAIPNNPLETQNDSSQTLTPSVLASFFKACSDELRLLILRVLKNDSYGVLELCQIFSLPQPRLSHHLKILSSAQLVATRREGNSIFYRRAFVTYQDGFEDLRRSIFNHIDKTSINAEIQSNMDGVHQSRAEISREFFEKNASRFRQQQDLIAHYEHYADSLQELLQVIPSKGNRVLEIGPGEGAFLLPLSQHFKSIFALDNAQEMLQQAQQFAQDQQLPPIEFMLGETDVALAANLRVDTIVMNMVLHHIPSPAKTLEDCAQLLEPQGHLIVTDLCSHDQTWVKETCGDLWLGFAPEDLHRWANTAGFKHQQNQFLGLRNGFQIQIHWYQKT